MFDVTALLENISAAWYHGPQHPAGLVVGTQPGGASGSLAEDGLGELPDMFGVPVDDGGERVHAAIQVRPGAPLTADEVTGFTREDLAGYEIPRGVSFHPHLPWDDAGKLLKRVLRDRAQT